MLLTNHNSGPQKTVLIVDDEHHNFFALAAVLKARGFKCLSAININEALKILDNYPDVGVILMDIMMPGVDGFDAIEMVKGKDIFKHIPIVVATALTTSEVKHKAAALGAVDVLTKPIDVSRLEAVLKMYLPV